MSTSDSLYRVGGLGLIGGAVLLAVGVFVHPLPDPMPVEAVALSGAEMAAHWLFTIGLVLLLAGIIALSRHFSGGAGEGLAVLALALSVLGYAMLVASWGVEAAVLVATGETAAALTAGTNVMVEMGRVLAWFALVPLGLAMLRDAAWPRALAAAGIVLGTLMAAGEFVIDEFSVLRLAFLIGFVWLAVVGWKLMTLTRATRAEASPADRPHVPVGGGEF